MSKPKKKKIVKEIENDKKEINVFSQELHKAIKDSDFDVIQNEIKAIAISSKNKKNTSNIEFKENDIDVSIKDMNSFYNLISVLQANLKSNTLSSKTVGLSDVSNNVKKSIDNSLGYAGFVFYIWNPKNLNIKIIPLTSTYPILDLKRMKEMYLLYKPTMFIDGKPIYFIIKNIPFSFEVSLFVDKKSLEAKLDLVIPTSSEVRAILKSTFIIYLFGKPLMSLSQLLYLLFLISTICLIEYIVLTSIFIGI